MLQPSVLDGGERKCCGLKGQCVRILLASPESHVWNSRAHIHMGLGYLAGSLLEAGFTNLTLHDAAVETESIAEALQRAIAEGEPYDIVGISSPTPLINEAWDAARQAKEAGAITVLGGPHLTLMPDESSPQARGGPGGPRRGRRHARRDRETVGELQICNSAPATCDRYSG